MGLGSGSGREGVCRGGFSRKALVKKMSAHCNIQACSTSAQQRSRRKPLTASMEEVQVIGNIPIRYEARQLNTARLCMGRSGVFF